MRDALRAVGNGKGMKILPGQWKEALAAIKAGKDIDYAGATGDIDFDKDGDVAGSYNQWEVKGGKGRRPRTGQVAAGTSGNFEPRFFGTGVFLFRGFSFWCRGLVAVAGLQEAAVATASRGTGASLIGKWIRPARTPSATPIHQTTS